MKENKAWIDAFLKRPRGEKDFETALGRDGRVLENQSFRIQFMRTKGMMCLLAISFYEQ